MNFNIINKRIEFSNKAQYLMYTYQATINKEVLFKRIKPTIAETYIKRKNINYFNYQLFMNLSLYKYKKVLPLYQSYRKNEIEANDISNILILFLPYLFDSTSQLIYSIKPSKDDYKNFKFSNKGNDKLEQKIKEFFESYYDLRISIKFDFHRKEIFSFLDSFLNIYVMKENNEINEVEKNKGLIYHYFRPFIRPEDYLKFNENS